MLLYLRPIPTLFFLLLCAYVVCQWARWFRSKEQVTPKWRKAATLAGFCLATFSTVLSVFLFVHASFTGGYPYYHPVEMFCIGFGFLSSFLGLAGSAVGKGKLGPHVAVISVLNMLLWFVDAAAQ